MLFCNWLSAGTSLHEHLFVCIRRKLHQQTNLYYFSQDLSSSLYPSSPPLFSLIISSLYLFPFVSLYHAPVYVFLDHPFPFVPPPPLLSSPVFPGFLLPSFSLLSSNCLPCLQSSASSLLLPSFFTSALPLNSFPPSLLPCTLLCPLLSDIFIY